MELSKAFNCLIKADGKWAVAEEGARFEVHFEKARGIHGEDVKPFEARLASGPGGKQLWTIQTIEDSLTARVARLLNDGVPQGELAEELGVSKGTVSKHKRKAQELGLLVIKGGL